MPREEFLKELNSKCRPHDIEKWSPEIYAYLSGLFNENCTDSVLREWAFQWASEKLGIKYDTIYKRWLGL